MVDYGKQLQTLIDSLKEPFPSLDTVCHDEHLLEVAREMTSSWKTIAPWLSFAEEVVEEIDDKRYDEEGKCQLLLMQWKRFMGPQATYRELAAGMVKSIRLNLAEFVVRASNRIPSQTETITRSFYNFSYCKHSVTPVFSSNVVEETPYRSTPIHDLPHTPVYSNDPPLSTSRSQLHYFNSHLAHSLSEMDDSKSNIHHQRSSDLPPSYYYHAQNHGVEATNPYNKATLNSADHLQQHGEGTTHHNVQAMDTTLHETQWPKENRKPCQLPIREIQENNSVRARNTLPNYLSDSWHILELGITPIQDQSLPSSNDSLCVNTQNYFVSPMVHDSLTSLCSGRTQSPFIPNLTTTEIMELIHRNKQLEQEKRTMCDVYERRLSNLRLEKQQLQLHCDQAYATSKHWELRAKDIVMKHQSGLCCIHCSGTSSGREDTDSSDTTPQLEQGNLCSSSSIDKEDINWGKHVYYRATSYYVHQGIINATSITDIGAEYHSSMCCQEHCNTGLKKGEEDENHGTVFKPYRLITLHIEETKLVEDARQRIAIHNLKLLETNARLTDIISNSLESLNDSSQEDVDGSCDGRDSLIRELKCVCNHLEISRLAGGGGLTDNNHTKSVTTKTVRHLSWP